MQPTVIPKMFSLSLTSAERARLRNIALWFGIEFHRFDPVNYRLSAADGRTGGELVLPEAIAHLRLLAEISSRAAKWIHFHLGVSCRDSLLGLTDDRLKRIAELYTLDLPDRTGTKTSIASTPAR